MLIVYSGDTDVIQNGNVIYTMAHDPSSEDRVVTLENSDTICTSHHVDALWSPDNAKLVIEQISPNPVDHRGDIAVLDSCTSDIDVV